MKGKGPRAEAQGAGSCQWPWVLKSRGAPRGEKGSPVPQPQVKAVPAECVQPGLTPQLPAFPTRGARFWESELALSGEAGCLPAT